MHQKNPVRKTTVVCILRKNVSLFFQVIGHIIIPPGAPPPGGPKGLDAAGAPGIPPGAPKGDGAKGLTVDA